ncbi:hypothetical protein [Streptomyces eurythermus]|uniref:hypothetical protein n=1 Tax=Streptomyces eurythermus TaxID=42237 RepID=UPI0036FB9AF1
MVKGLLLIAAVAAVLLFALGLVAMSHGKTAAAVIPVLFGLFLCAASVWVLRRNKARAGKGE